MAFNLSKRPDVKLGIEIADYCETARKLQLPVAVIRAVDDVESAGSGFLLSSERPKLLFEGHYFYRLLSKYGLAEKARKLQPTICYPKWTTAHYLGREGEYGRIAKATELCHSFGVTDGLALRSASWGRYQIMGDNYARCGFGSVEAFVEAMFQDEDNHLEAFAEYISATFLDDELRNLPSNPIKYAALFALSYNGPGYKRNNYHTKISNAFARFKRQNVDCSTLPAVGQVVTVIPGERFANPSGFENTSLDDRYYGFLAGISDDEIGSLTAGITQDSTADPAGSHASPPQRPAPHPVESPAVAADQSFEVDSSAASAEVTMSETKQTAEGSATFSMTTPPGDPPDAEPSGWLTLEDWKPWCFKWLGRTWKGVGSVNFAQAGGFGLGAFRDPGNWYVYVAIAVVIMVLVLGAAVIVSGGLLGLWLWNRSEIAAGKTLAAQTLVDPTQKNLGVRIEKIYDTRPKLRPILQA